MVVGHVMIVTGGYRTGTVQDFASESLVYDIRCEHWEKLDVKGVVLKCEMTYVC